MGVGNWVHCGLGQGVEGRVRLGLSVGECEERVECCGVRMRGQADAGTLLCRCP